MRTKTRITRKRLLAGTQAVPALPGLSATGRAGRVQLPAKLSIITAHSLWQSWDMTPCAMQWRPNKFVLHMPLQHWQIQQHALARSDTGSIQSTHTEIKGSPRLLPETHWPPLPPSSLALSKIQKIRPLCFQNVSVSRSFPPLFFLRPIKNKSLPERQQGKKKASDTIGSSL